MYPCNQPCFTVYWLIGSYIWLFSKLQHTKSICDTLFDLQHSSELLQKPWHHGHNSRKWLKQPQSHFYWVVPSKSHLFLLLWCMLRTTTPDISSSSKNIHSTAHVSRLSFHFLWLWFILSAKLVTICKSLITTTLALIFRKRWISFLY